MARHSKKNARKRTRLNQGVGKHAVSVRGGVANVKCFEPSKTTPLMMTGIIATVLSFAIIMCSQVPTDTIPTRSLSYTNGFTVSRSSYRARLNRASSLSDHASGFSTVKGSWSLNENDEVPYSKSFAEKAQDLMADQTAMDIQSLESKGEGAVMVDSDLTLTAEVVAQLNKQYSGHEPIGWDPNHPTGDTGNAYEYSQCTWWAYKRRHELGLPAGSHMGDGRMWTSTGKILGYWVDHTPHIGDAISFPAGVLGSSSQYGHVAIVENFFQYNGKTYIKTSESGSSYNGHHFSRIIGDPERFEYVHY